MGKKRYTKISKIKDRVDSLKYEVIQKRREVRSYLYKIQSFDFVEQEYSDFIVLVDNCIESLNELDRLTQLLTKMRKYYEELSGEFDRVYTEKLIEYKELKLRERTNNLTDVTPILRNINDQKFGLIIDAVKRKLPLIIYDTGLSAYHLFQSTVMLLKGATFILNKYEIYVPDGNKKVLLDRSTINYKKRLKKEINYADDYVVIESVENIFERDIVDNLVKNNKPVIAFSKLGIPSATVEYTINYNRIATTQELTEQLYMPQITATDYKSLHKALLESLV